MKTLDAKGISYEPATNFKFKFGTLTGNRLPFDDRKIEDLLDRVEKKIGLVIAGNLGMKKIVM